jgi:NAD(P)-dependent dehydrogenase (short-subunit alcohol dehydrogenase family)
MPDTQPKVWLITGCSGGFGRAMSEQLLARGDRVLMTVRDPAAVLHLCEKYPATARSFALSLADPEQIASVVREAESCFGGIDVLVNNAGYVLFGGVEEATPAQYRAIFEVNFFGALEVMRAVLPGMRARRHGHVINISSMAGISGGLGMPYYAATKFALTAVSESLALEAGHLNIKVTIVEPGAHRTAIRQNWIMADPLAAYTDSIGVARESLPRGYGKEPGDPELAARAIIAIGDSEHPPLHIPLGKDAVARLENKIATATRDLEAWRELAYSTGS